MKFLIQFFNENKYHNAQQGEKQCLQLNWSDILKHIGINLQWTANNNHRSKNIFWITCHGIFSQFQTDNEWDLNQYCRSWVIGQVFGLYFRFYKEENHQFTSLMDFWKLKIMQLIFVYINLQISISRSKL